MLYCPHLYVTLFSAQFVDADLGINFQLFDWASEELSEILREKKTFHLLL